MNCNNSSVISCVDEIVFGENVLIGGYVTIRDSDGHKIYNADEPEKLQSTSKRVVVGNHVWICSKCDILKGTVIPDNNIVGYGALCTKEYIGENQIIAGSPAKVIKDGVNWDY